MPIATVAPIVEVARETLIAMLAPIRAIAVELAHMSVALLLVIRVVVDLAGVPCVQLPW